LELFGRESAAGAEYLRSQDRLILIARENKVAQAVSLTRATRSRIFGRHVGEEPAEEKMEWTDSLVFEISRSLAAVTAQDTNWRDCLAQYKLPFLEVRYENILDDYSGEITRVLEYLGLDCSLAGSAAPTTLKIGSGNEEIEERYLSSIGVKRGSS
jgi:LPS sulfotransferase NodH